MIPKKVNDSFIQVFRVQFLALHLRKVMLNALHLPVWNYIHQMQIYIYRARTSNCRPLWVTLDLNVVIIRIFLKFPRKDTDNTRSFCLITAS